MDPDQISQNLRYRKVEGRSRRTILMLHGFPGCKEVFYDGFPYFNGEYNLISVDLPGFGQSHEDIPLLSVEEMVAVIQCFIDMLHIDPTELIIYGKSFGGVLGIMYAAENHLDRLIIEGTPLQSAHINPKEFKFADTLLPPLSSALIHPIYKRIRSHRWLANLVHFYTSRFGKGEAVAVPKHLLGSVLSGMDLQQAKIVREYLGRFNIEHKLDDLACKVIAVYSENDSTVYSKPATTQLKERVENLSLLMYEMDGHVPTFWKPKECIEAIASLLD